MALLYHMMHFRFVCFYIALIMHQHFGVTHIISMVILNLEVICRLRTFQQFMLNLFDNDILAIEHDENITGSEVNCACPTLFGDIERVLRF